MREEDRTPGRPRGFDMDAVLDIITGLFWERGYEAVSLADIMAATGLRKGSLYAAYGDKRAMYLKALARYEAAHVARTVALLRGPGPARVRLEAFLAAPIEAAYEGDDRRGCFLCNASADLAAADEEAASLVRQGFARLQRALAATLAELAPGDDPTPRAAQLLVSYAGLQVMARIGMPRAMLAAARDLALVALPAGGR
ncbi:MAG: TetR/AcrR family transcriptional regulator [Pseudomonadota bacterium]